MLSSVPCFSILFGTHLCCPSVSGFKIKRQQQKKTQPNHFKYLAPCFHLPPEGAHLHQAGHRGGRFDGRAAVLLWHGALGAVDELDAGDGPLSHAQVAGRRARPSPHDLPPGSTTAIVFYLSFLFFFFRRFCPLWLISLVWTALPGRAAVMVAGDHSCGFGEVAALGVLHHLLLLRLPLCFPSTVQHPVGHASSARYTAHSLLGAPPVFRKSFPIPSE